ncbi:MAG: hypothetical protein F4X11_11190 [Acidobacteria bacterium]|nr:hypothetical protein [Acidobacteriota bacterium]
MPALDILQAQRLEHLRLVGRRRHRVGQLGVEPDLVRLAPQRGQLGAGAAQRLGVGGHARRLLAAQALGLHLLAAALLRQLVRAPLRFALDVAGAALDVARRGRLVDGDQKPLVQRIHRRRRCRRRGQEQAGEQHGRQHEPCQQGPVGKQRSERLADVLPGRRRHGYGPSSSRRRRQ